MILIEQELEDLNAWIAEHVMGWERVDVDYYEQQPLSGFVKCREGWFNTPSVAKWESLLDSEGIENVGVYWLDTNEKKFFDSDDFKPTIDPAAAMMVQIKCVERLTLTIDKEFNDILVRFGSSRDSEVRAISMPLAICLAAKKIFGGKV